ncbi:ribosome silencing factor [Lutibacter sp. B2]|nr:ribosome silencing factor [Lutibacter sp. B2]
MIKTSKETIKEMINAIDDKKGQETKVLDLKGISNFTDYFVIAHGTSNRQVKAIADEIEEKLESMGIFVNHKEGHNEGKWILLDYIDIVVHVFVEEERYFYNIERAWKDAEFIDADSL